MPKKSPLDLRVEGFLPEQIAKMLKISEEEARSQVDTGLRQYLGELGRVDIDLALGLQLLRYEYAHRKADTLTSVKITGETIKVLLHQPRGAPPPPPPENEKKRPDPGTPLEMSEQELAAELEKEDAPIPVRPEPEDTRSDLEVFNTEV